MRLSTFISIALMSAAVTWMFVDAIPGLAGRVMAEQADRDYPEPEVGIVAVAAASLEADPLPEPQQRKETFGPWQRVKITTYGPGYHGKLTNSGERFSDHKLTAAAPVKGRTKAGRHIPSIPFGTYVEVRYGARSVVVKINDTCIGGTLDLSRAAMTELLGRYEETKLKGEFRVVQK